MTSLCNDTVTSYAEQVVSGSVVCGSLHKKVCQRHLRDLERQNTEEFPYYWDSKASERAIKFASSLSLAEGSEQKPLVLIPSQAFDIGCTFGWKKTSNDCRRFRRRYKSIGRQNGRILPPVKVI